MASWATMGTMGGQRGGFNGHLTSFNGGLMLMYGVSMCFKLVL
jgi:hypothetical protein